MAKSIVGILLFLISTNVWATYGYYMVKEKVVVHNSKSQDFDPISLADELLQSLEGPAMELYGRFYSLVSFEFHNSKYGDVNQPYQRNKHFGTWIVDHREPGCMNTRARVLERDSLSQVSMGASGCAVEKGRWEDPYSSKVFRWARDIQIDHFVPLKNAYMSGAYKWNSEKRCLFANFLGNDYHLLPVYGPENSSKGDQGPEGYMPPNKGYHCQYLAQWLKVKFIWSLALTPTEKAVVVNMIKSNQCAPDDFLFSEVELDEQRQFIADNISICE